MAKSMWWRTDSPIRDGERDYSLDSPSKAPEKSEGVFGWGKKPQYYTCYQVGSGSRHNFSSVRENKPTVVSGYSGFIPGKYAGNIIGGTFNQTNFDAENHLRRTVQAMRIGGERTDAAREEPKSSGAAEQGPPGSAPPSGGSRPPSGTTK